MKKIKLALVIILFITGTFTLAGVDHSSQPAIDQPVSVTALETVPRFIANADSCSVHTIASKCNSSQADDGRKCCWKGSEEHPRGGECGICKAK